MMRRTAFHLIKRINNKTTPQFNHTFLNTTPTSTTTSIRFSPSSPTTTFHTNLTRNYSANKSELTKEQLITQVLTEKFSPILLNVQDVSGGCGSMFNVLIVSDDFKGQSPVKRHRAVHEILKEDIREMHGISLLLKTEDEYRAMLEKAGVKQ